MTSTQPIAGNQNFTKVSSAPEPVAKLSAGDVKAGSVLAGSVVKSDPGQSNVVVGFAPSSFATGDAASAHNLLVSAGGAPATDADAASLLRLPADALVTRVVVSNNGTAVVGGTSFTVGTKDATIANALTNDTTTNMVASMLLATVNAANGGGAVGGTTGTTELALGTAGQAVTTSSLVAQAQGAFESLVAVVVNGTANTAGDLRVEIHYQNA
jgi:hypothetical protein